MKVQEKNSRKFQPTTGAPRTRLHKKLQRSKLDDVTKEPEYLMNKIEMFI